MPTTRRPRVSILALPILNSIRLRSFKKVDILGLRKNLLIVFPPNTIWIRSSSQLCLIKMGTWIKLPPNSPKTSPQSQVSAKLQAQVGIRLALHHHLNKRSLKIPRALSQVLTFIKKCCLASSGAGTRPKWEEALETEVSSCYPITSQKTLETHRLT